MIIHLETTICSCEYKGCYGWHISVDKEGYPNLKITCDQCGTNLLIPKTKFKAGFEIKELPEENKEQPKQKCESVGNVIYLFKKDN